METATLHVDKHEAREALREYREARRPATQEDRDIMEAYSAIARGAVVIQALESIRRAGWNEEGLPKLALTRADQRRCYTDFSTTVACFHGDSRNLAKVRVDRMPTRPQTRAWRGEAIVPLIPLPLRPKAALDNYWILWEADWHRVPTDPMLLRKLSGDMWIVLAAWDLTAVERAVLERRLNS